jgi:hypothetical protein
MQPRFNGQPVGSFRSVSDSWGTVSLGINPVRPEVRLYLRFSDLASRSSIQAANPFQRRRRAVISWFTALFNLGGLWAGAATPAYLASTLIVAMAKLNNLEYISTSGESYAIYLAVILFGLGSSLVSAVKFTRMLDSSMAWFSVLGLVTIAVTILAMTTPKAPAVSAFD